MGLFCKKCGSILRPKSKAGKKIMYCACGYEETPEGEMIISEELEETKAMEAVQDSTELLPKVRTRCEKCENDVAYYWTQQTRAADEPETRFFKCTKCKHTWREYS